MKSSKKSIEQAKDITIEYIISDLKVLNYKEVGKVSKYIRELIANY